MTRSDWISVAGLVLGLFFGIPTLVAWQYPGSEPLAIVAASSLVILLLVVWLAVRVLRAPDWTIVARLSRIALQDVTGTRAIWTEAREISANRQNCDTYTFRSVSATNNAGLSPRAGDGIEWIKTTDDAGATAVTAKLYRKVPLFRRTSIELIIDAHGCFTAQRETHTAIVDQTTRELTIEIEFPEGATPKEYAAEFFTNGRSRPLNDLRLMGRQLRWSRKRTFLGLPLGDYKIHWSR